MRSLCSGIPSLTSSEDLVTVVTYGTFGVIRITKKSLERNATSRMIRYSNGISDAYRNDKVIAYVISQTIVKLSHNDGYFV